MLRIDLVNKAVYEYCSSLTVEDISKDTSIGLSSIDISDSLNILRNNASADLNKLFKDGILIKIKGKPTKYFNKEVFESLFNLNLVNDVIECSSLNELTNIPTSEVNEISYDYSDPFDSLVGSHHSLAHIIKLAKSSILYPNCLHTILLGESGVGKSFFAELMYKFGLQHKVFNGSSSFVVFNCADYANNPNLLVAQLFGCVKGAYTGADSDRIGLIEKADGGILFLDEIHRLPPEGQEMLFLFIDKKRFRRLGEVTSERTSNVLIIAATTENPNSSLLTTFMRRIPSCIRIPNLKDRSLTEKFSLVNRLYSIEAKKINKHITVSKDCITDLILYNPPGNIGQLSSDIQLSVAQAFLYYKLDNSKKLMITKDYLPLYASSNLLNVDISTRKNVALLINKNEYVFSPNSEYVYMDNIGDYEFIKKFNRKLSSKEADGSELQEIFQNYTDLISKNFAIQNNYPDFIDGETSEIISTLSDILYNDLNLIIDKSSYIALALYLKNLKDYIPIENNHSRKLLDISDIPRNIVVVCKNIVETLERKFNIYCPVEEINNLSIIINSLKTKEVFEPVGIMIAAHGDSLATNIANVANELLGIDFALPIDMPLSETPSNILDSVISHIKDKSFSRGLILFADMGSLTHFDDVIKENTGINIITIESINILLVIESIRKSIFLKSDMDDILHDLIGLNHKLNLNFHRKIENHLSINKKRIIYTVCSSGEGVAYYLEQNIKDLLNEYNIFDVDIIPLNIESTIQLRDVINQTSLNKKPIAIVGSINPDINEIPFISLDDVVLHNGLEKIISLLGIKINIASNRISKELTKDIIINITSDTVDKYLTILSAAKVKSILMDFINNIESKLNISMNNSSLTKIFIHLACLIERILIKDFILTSQEEITSYMEHNIKIINAISDSLTVIEETFNIKIPDNELYFLCEIVNDAIKNSL